jgi:hypothetical protein
MKNWTGGRKASPPGTFWNGQGREQFHRPRKQLLQGALDQRKGGTMKAIVRRLLKLEVLATPKLTERGETLADVIRARRKRLIEECGATFEERPQASLAGARSIGEIIVRSRQLYRESACIASAPGT